MSRNRTSSWLAAGVLLLLAAASARAQQITEELDSYDYQLFAPADVTPYDGGPEQRQGYFFGFDGLLWSISKPALNYMGLPPPYSRVVFYGTDTNYVTQFSTFNNSQLASEGVTGDRFDLGYMGKENGWYLSGFKLQDQNQLYYGSNVNMVMNDPPVDNTYGITRLSGLVTKTTTWVIGGIDTFNSSFPGNPPYTPPQPITPPSLSTTYRVVDIPLTFPSVVCNNTVQNYGVELNYVRRLEPLHNGGIVDFLFGARYFKLNEEFTTRTYSPIQMLLPATTPGTPPTTLVNLPAAGLDDSYWTQVVENSIVGPQLGARFTKGWGRFQLMTEGKFAAGLNEQQYRQYGAFGTRLAPNMAATPNTTYNLGTGVPLAYTGNGFNNSDHVEQFSPVAELRAEARYELFRTVSIHAGWTGLWVGGIARASDSILYSLPNMGIDTSLNNQSVFINGLTFGVDINR